MDQQQLQEKIAQYYSKLPPKAQQAFASMNWLETLRSISKSHSLNDAQTETLGAETTLVLLGMVHLGEYRQKLVSELGLPSEITNRIVAEIDDQILKDIHPELTETYDANVASFTEKGPEVGQKLDEDIIKLPKEIEKVIEESDYQAIIYGIAKNYNFNVEQTGILEKAVTDLMLGSIAPEDFEGYLESSLKLKLEALDKLVSEIDEKIFKKIRSGLMKETERNQVFERGVGAQSVNTEVANVDMKKEGVELKKAGIEIVPGKLELPEAGYPEPAPILHQKLSGVFKATATETEHTLENITKNPPAQPSASAAKPKVDPYREIPE